MKVGQFLYINVMYDICIKNVDLFHYCVILLRCNAMHINVYIYSNVISHRLNLISFGANLISFGANLNSFRANLISFGAILNSYGTNQLVNGIYCLSHAPR